MMDSPLSPQLPQAHALPQLVTPRRQMASFLYRLYRRVCRSLRGHNSPTFFQQGNPLSEGNEALDPVAGYGALGSCVSRTISVNKDTFQQYACSTVAPASPRDSSLTNTPPLARSLTRKSLESSISFASFDLQNPTARLIGQSIFGWPVIDPYATSYKWWCCFILLVDCTYSAFFVPIGVGLGLSEQLWGWGFILDLIAGFFFVVDMILNFSTGFVAKCDLRRVVVTDGWAIAKYYVRHGTLAVDFLSSVSWGGQVVTIILSLANVSLAPPVKSVLNCLRLLRIARETAMLKSMFLSAIRGAGPKVKYISAGTLSLVRILYTVAVLVNFLGCMWYFTAAMEGLDGTWVNYYTPFRMQYGAGEDVLSRHHVDRIPIGRRYIASVYWALTTITTLGYGDITPVTAAETVVAMSVMLLGVMFFGVLLASITEMIARLSSQAKKAQLYRDKMLGVEKWMRQYKVPRITKQRIRRYYLEEWTQQQVDSVSEELFRELPQALTEELTWHLTHRMFPRLRLLSDLDSCTQKMLASKCVMMRPSRGQNLCQQGDVADGIWILQEGSVCCVWNDQQVEIVVEPALLGDGALLAESVAACRWRRYGYRCLTNCLVWQLRTDAFVNVLLTQGWALEDIMRHATAHCQEYHTPISQFDMERGLLGVGLKTEYSAHGSPESGCEYVLNSPHSSPFERCVSCTNHMPPRQIHVTADGRTEANTAAQKTWLDDSGAHNRADPAALLHALQSLTQLLISYQQPQHVQA